MSSILKALKKLEEEKSLSQEEREINVSREILRQQHEPGNIRRWLWLLGSGAAVVIIILTLALIRATAPKEEQKPGSKTASSQPVPAPSPTVPNETVSPAPVRNAKGIDNSSPLATGERKPDKPLQIPAPAVAPPAKSEAVELPATHGPLPELQRPEPAQKPAVVRENRAGEPTLTLSGIAWNKDSADRLAIINGQPTATGGAVSGAIVEEILPDRVKLSLNGRIVELFIGRSARTD